MRLLTLSSLLATTLAIILSYNTSYDEASRSLQTRAYSTGDNGLLTRGFKTQSALPNFPAIGGSFAVTGWNSTGCGTCWTLTWKNRQINVMAVYFVAQGFNIAKAAMDALTNGRAGELGRIEVDYKQVDGNVCGL